MKGYVRLHRKFFDSWIWQNELYIKAWCWLLLKAVGDPNGYKGLKRGQVQFSVRRAPKEWGMSVKQARSFLHKLEQDSAIIWERGDGGRKSKDSKKGTVKGTVFEDQKGTVFSTITICNYDEYNPYDIPKGTVFEDQKGTDKGTLINKVPNKYKNNVKKPNSNPSKSQPKTPKKGVHKPNYVTGTRLKTELKALGGDLSKYHSKYDPELVQKVFNEFNEKLSNKEFKYTSIRGAFSTWLKNRVKWDNDKQNKQPDYRNPAERAFFGDDS